MHLNLPFITTRMHTIITQVLKNNYIRMYAIIISFTMRNSKLLACDSALFYGEAKQATNT